MTAEITTTEKPQVIAGIVKHLLDRGDRRAIVLERTIEGQGAIDRDARIPTAYNERGSCEAIVVVKPTLIEFSESLTEALENLARQTGRPPTDLIQEAVEIYLSQQNAPLPPSVGMGASGRTDLSQRDEELLWQDR